MSPTCLLRILRSTQRMALVLAVACSTLSCRLEPAGTDPGTPAGDVGPTVPDTGPSDADPTPDAVTDDALHPDVHDAENDASSDPLDPEGGQLEPEPACLLVAVSDYAQSGFISTLDLESGTVRADVSTTWQDAELRVLEGTPWILNRLGADNLQRLESRTLRTHWQRSLGRRANPWDLAPLDDDHMLVALYGDGTLQRVLREPGEEEEVRVGPAVDLSPWDPVDGNPEPARLLRQGDHILVMLQRLTRFVCDTNQNGGVLVLEADTLEPPSGVGDHGLLSLSRCSPVTWARLPGHRLAVGLSGGYRVRGQTSDDGGIEVLNLNRWYSEGLVLTESDLGDRDVVRLAESADGGLWALLADGAFQNSVHYIDTAQEPWSVSLPYWSSEGAYALLEHNGYLYVGDSTPGQTGVRVFDVNAPPGTVPIRTYNVGGPPRGFALLPSACP